MYLGRPPVDPDLYQPIRPDDPAAETTLEVAQAIVDGEQSPCTKGHHCQQIAVAMEYRLDARTLANAPNEPPQEYACKCEAVGASDGDKPLPAEHCEVRRTKH